MSALLAIASPTVVFATPAKAGGSNLNGGLFATTTYLCVSPLVLRQGNNVGLGSGDIFIADLMEGGRYTASPPIRIALT